MTLATGTTLGPYEILGQIGAGGMGEVYRARDPRLGREVAIKVLPASFSADPDRLRRFEQEAKAAGVLNHPNITAVYDIGQHDGAPYVVQELLEGETLRAELAGGRFSPRKAIDTATQIARGLAAAHEKGIVHRDLKPENVFVTRDGRVKILDFGLAKLTEPGDGSPSSNLPTATRGTEPGVVLGTLGYMSPEQVRGQAADARSDIFSFGTILYEMLAGRRAFHGDSAADTMSAILREDPPDLSITNQSVSPALERIVRHCLEKKPEQRFHSAHDVAFALDAISGASAPSAVATLPPAGRPRSRWALTAGALAAAAGLAAALLLLRAGGNAPEPPVYRLLTFRRGTVQAARFAPDGQTVVYSAAWEGSPTELYQARIGLPESLPLGVPGGGIVAGVTASGEMVAIFNRSGGSTLARLPITGGAPREVAEAIAAADIRRDGQAVAVVRWIGGAFRLEYPVGKALHESSGGIGYPRISPDGESVAFFDHPLIGDDRGSLAVVGRDGKKKTLTREWASAGGIAWNPSGDEIWFSATDHGANLTVRAVTLSGKERRILPGPGRLILHDIAPDGRLLLEERTLRRALMFSAPGKPERDLSWLDYSNLAAISGDGSLVLIGETGEGGGAEYAVYVRKTDGSPAVRLGAGIPDSLSPDGRWVVSLGPGKNHPVVLLPLGAGEPRTLPDFGMRVREARLLPDGKRAILVGARPNEPLAIFLADVESGKVTRIGSEAIGAPSANSPDGRLLFAVGADNRAFLHRIDEPSAEPRPIRSFEAEQWPAGWTRDGRYLFLARMFDRPLRVYRVDLSTDTRELWREIDPPDATGDEGFSNLQVALDGQTCAYTYSRSVSELFVVEGVK